MAFGIKDVRFYKLRDLSNCSHCLLLLWSILSSCLPIPNIFCNKGQTKSHDHISEASDSILKLTFSLVDMLINEVEAVFHDFDHAFQHILIKQIWRPSIRQSGKSVWLCCCIWINTLTWYGVYSCITLLLIWNYTKPLMFRVYLMSLYSTYDVDQEIGLRTHPIPIRMACCFDTNLIFASPP